MRMLIAVSKTGPASRSNSAVGRILFELLMMNSKWGRPGWPHNAKHAIGSDLPSTHGDRTRLVADSKVVGKRLLEELVLGVFMVEQFRSELVKV